MWKPRDPTALSTNPPQIPSRTKPPPKPDASATTVIRCGLSIRLRSCEKCGLAAGRLQPQCLAETVNPFLVAFGSGVVDQRNGPQAGQLADLVDLDLKLV